MKIGELINTLTYVYMNNGDVDVAVYKDGKISTSIETMYDEKSSVFMIFHEETGVQNV